MKSIPKILFTVSETSEMLRISRNVFKQRFVDTNLIPRVILPGSNKELYHIDDILALINNSKYINSRETNTNN